MQQCALIYKKDKDLEIEKDLGIKTGDAVVFSSLNRKRLKVDVSTTCERMAPIAAPTRA